MSPRWQYTQVTCTPEEVGIWNRRKKWVYSYYNLDDKKIHRFAPQPDSFLDLLNEVGRQGWELASTFTMATTTVSNDGEPDVQEPLRMAWYFKRPIPE